MYVSEDAPPKTAAMRIFSILSPSTDPTRMGDEPACATIIVVAALMTVTPVDKVTSALPVELLSVPDMGELIVVAAAPLLGVTLTATVVPRGMPLPAS